jgi:N-acetylglucosaminyl-diphospho-decaprenol L-rhamnosyltransferase
MPADCVDRSRHDVTISIVSLNTRELLAACLRSVLATTRVTFDVHVVDNGSSDGSTAMVAVDFPQVRLTRSGSNRGFAAANNCAIREADSRYVLLLNPDTIVSPQTVGDLVSFMDDHADVGICGPKIMFPDGRFQSCGYRFPTLMSEVRQSKNVNRLLRRLVGTEPPLHVEPVPFDVDWVDGACLLIRREAIDDVGFLDEQFFLYAEELDWCFRARKAGWRICALPHVEMAHYQGQSSGQMSDFSLAHLVETRLRYYRKNHGVTTAAITSLVYAMGSVHQLKRDRRKAKVKLQATIRWWRTLLAA